MAIIEWTDPAWQLYNSMMHRRFKLLYFYDETEDTVHIVDIWDTRMKPETLMKRIK
jgi:hypothetical protein